MATKIDENTQVTFDLKTIIAIVVVLSSFIGMWFALQKDIEEATFKRNLVEGETHYSWYLFFILYFSPYK